MLSKCSTCFKCEDCGASLLDVTKKKAEIDEKLNKHNLYCGTCYLVSSRSVGQYSPVEVYLKDL